MQVTVNNTSPATLTDTNNSVSLSSNVTLTAANTYYTVLSVTLPEAGKYLVMSDAVIANTSGTASIVTMKIHNSTTNYASGIVNRSMYFDTMQLHALITVTGSTTITLSAAANNTNNIIDAIADNNAAGATTTKLTYVRIA